MIYPNSAVRRKREAETEAETEGRNLTKRQLILAEKFHLFVIFFCAQNVVLYCDGCL